jgi:regulator of PEP synthase PpsR (kinase-PPPase family)
VKPTKKSVKSKPKAKTAPTPKAPVVIAPSAPAIPSAPPTIYVLSDSTGNLARHTLAALATQFPADSFSTQFHSFIRNHQRLEKVLEHVSQHPGPIFHAMVSDDFKNVIASFCANEKLPHHDLTGSAVEFITRVTGALPHGDVASLHRIDESYKRRIGAVEYTLAHDDGLGLATLSDADIVLVGVSRTGKTPTSIYLAQQGYHVANVSLAMEVPPPPALLNLPPKKVVGLVINPQQLVMIRTRRETSWGMARTSYGEPAHVAREIAWARQLFVRQGWPILDITDQAIEETSAKVTEALGLTCAPMRSAGSDQL